MRKTYPAILTPFKKGNGYTVEFPDLLGCVTEGDTLENAIDMGQDAATGYIISEIADGNNLPKASNQRDIKLKSNQLVSLIVCDTASYDEKYSNKVVRKNISIPAYLNTYGEKHNINFSKIVKDYLSKVACL